MNKNLSKIIAVAAAVTTVSAFAPVTNANFLTTKAYASSTNDDDEFSRVTLRTASGDSTIKLYEDEDREDKADNDDLSSDTTYYAKTSSNKVTISTSGVAGKYVRVFCDSGSDISNSKKGVKTGENLSLKSGKNKIVIRIYEKAPIDNPKYEDDEHKLADYEIEVKCSGSSSSGSSSENGDVYLDTLSVDDKEISLSKSKTTYTKTVSSSTDSVTITAEPEDNDDYVTIDGDTVDEDDDWEKEIDLKKGRNEFKIEVEDDDDDDEVRTYTLVIYRGENTATSDSILLDYLEVGGKSLTLSENKKEYNLKVGEDTDEVYIKAEPKDSDYTVTIGGAEVDDEDDYEVNATLKKNVVNTFKVKVTGNGKTQEYNVNIGRGDKVTGYPTENNTTTNTTVNNSNNTNVAANKNKWVQTGSLWQYYDGAGNAVKNTFVSNYYLGENSYMVTNSWKAINGSWYYFDANGVMQTGWLQLGSKWYYLNSDGRMATGWLHDMNSGKWYFLYSDGSMASNTYIGNYRLGSNGAWIY